ncbi:putative membrane protein [Wickerhamomyces ciferrii]|uniref:Membrane protein n=1 Tax=Wickerhamomyces ciferrii (strain ATCC 14091 / BCRC 22168 / CBS 111 / JCM 3599 / NBRC 0793 / NRRL Y-1031 F-60-10) TaxID=1206466 RepID=K0KTY7_WICCF|nr:uncharacterized protein BN7_4428 [Wickerhamomyces ciferrii]CCH44859.1 putative membrane protein [Wickerhamomyces ciferrii]
MSNIVKEPTIDERSITHSDSDLNISQDKNQLSQTESLYPRQTLLKKLDFTILPTLSLIFFVFSLDRANLSQVLTDNFLEDLQITQNVTNAAVAILWGAICIGDIPSNIILSKIGAKYWIPLQVILWGIVSTFQAFIKTRQQFLATRFLLGLCESGFIPNSMAFLASYTTREEYGKRVVLYFYGNGFAGMFGPLIASGILKMRGYHDWPGWRWLWLIEGIFTIFIGLISFLLLPKSIDESSTVMFGELLNNDETECFIAQLKLQDRAINNSDQTSSRSKSITFGDVKETLKDWRIYPHFLMALTGLPAFQPTTTYGSLILKQLGFSTINSNLLAIPWGAGGLITTLVLVTISDKFKDRSLPMLIGSIWSWILAIIIKTKSQVYKRWSFYALYTIYQIAPSWHNINAAWIAENQITSQRRSVVLALYFMSANAAAIPGAQIFRANDSPNYPKGWIAILVLFVCLNVIIVLQRFQYVWSNKRKARKLKQLNELGELEYLDLIIPGDTSDLTFKHPL